MKINNLDSSNFKLHSNSIDGRGLSAQDIKGKHGLNNVTSNVSKVGESNIDKDTDDVVVISARAKSNALYAGEKEFDLADITANDVTAIKVDRGLLSEQGPLANRDNSLSELRRNAALNGTPMDLLLEPLYQEFLMDNTRHIFPEGTLESFITNALDDKARNSSFVAKELAMMIKSAGYGNGETIEERAINREIGMKNAEYIAKTYFDNPDEAQAFLDEINRFYEKDILTEKGYIAPDNAPFAPYRSYSMPNAPEGFVNGKATLKHFGAPDDVINDPEKAIRFLASLAPKMKGGQYQIDIAKAFEENEKRIASILEQIKATPLNDEDVAKSLARVLKAF